MYLKQVLTEVGENLVQTLIGQIGVVEAENPHRGKHLKLNKYIFCIVLFR